MYFITFINYIILIGFLVGRRVFFFIPVPKEYIHRKEWREEGNSERSRGEEKIYDPTTGDNNSPTPRLNFRKAQWFVKQQAADHAFIGNSGLK